VDLIIVDPHQPQIDTAVPLITIPGSVQSIAWSPNGQAAVVLTTQDSPIPTQTANPARPTPTTIPRLPTDPVLVARNAVLIQLPEQGKTAHATRLRVPPDRPGGLVPLAWSEQALWWVTDTGLGLALDRISLADGTTERVGPLPETIAALTVMPDQHLRVLVQAPDGSLTVQRWPEPQTLFTLPTIQAHGPVGGIWQGSELMLATNPQTLWYVTLQPEALR
jgi:hypothetical protein